MGAHAPLRLSPYLFTRMPLLHSSSHVRVAILVHPLPSPITRTSHCSAARLTVPPPRARSATTASTPISHLLTGAQPLSPSGSSNLPVAAPPVLPIAAKSIIGPSISPPPVPCWSKSTVHASTKVYKSWDRDGHSCKTTIDKKLRRRRPRRAQCYNRQWRLLRPRLTNALTSVEPSTKAGVEVRSATGCSNGRRRKLEPAMS